MSGGIVAPTGTRSAPMIRNTRVTYLLLLTATAACQDRTGAPVAPRLSLNASAGACPTPANVIVTDEAGLNAALAAAAPGEVIGLGAFFGVTADVIVNTPKVTLTCATVGA